MVDIFLNRYVIHDVKIDGLRLNLVAYNDSINNYNIAPTAAMSFKKMPYISAHLISLKNPGTMSYISLATDTRASLKLADFRLIRIPDKVADAEKRAEKSEGAKEGPAPSGSMTVSKGDKMGYDNRNRYSLELNGDVTLESSGLTVLNGFPFDLSGDLRLRFDPFGVQLSDYDITLGAISSRLNMSVGIGDNPSVENFDYHLSSVNLMSLLGYLPKEFIPSLQGLEANMPLTASARLLNSWSLSSETFPSIRIDFSIPEGDMTYTFAGSTAALRRLPLHYSSISGIFLFNGANPNHSYLTVNPFNINADGIDAALAADIRRLTESPEVAATLNLRSDLGRLHKYIPLDGIAVLGGRLAMDSEINFRITDFSRNALNDGLRDLRIAASIDVAEGHVNLPGEGLDLRFSDLRAPLTASVETMTREGLLNPKATFRLSLDRMGGNLPAGSFGAENLNVNSSAGKAGMLTAANVEKGLPISAEVTAGKLNFADPKQGMSVTAEGCRIADFNGADGFKSILTAAAEGVSFASERVHVDAGKSSFDIHEPLLRFSLSERARAGRIAGGENAVKDQAGKGLTDGNADRSSVAKDKEGTEAERGMAPLPFAHTPRLIAVQVPEKLKSLLNDYDFNTFLKIKRIDLKSPGLHDADYIADLDVDLRPDSLVVNNIDMTLESTRARMRGVVGNLRNFLLLPAAESNPLDFRMTLALDTVNFNALARAYVDSRGGMQNIPKHPVTTPDDTVSLLIPRNLRGALQLSARETIYTNLHLYDLNADVNLEAGNLDIPHLGIDADFGRGDLAIAYLSSDARHLSLSGDLNVGDINITRFFQNFPALLRMAPQMKNLTGWLSAGIGFQASIFPDMYVNVPSATADMQIKGWDLKVHQNKFIRRITKMMLIHTDDDIHIKDIDVHAGIHGNLLQLDPFDFEFDRYKLHMLGVNNFNGNLYYHIAVMKSPIPFPFSVNIEGLFRDPELAFGGPKYNLKRSEKVTSQIQEENNVNMVTVLKQFLRAFVKKAAES